MSNPLEGIPQIGLPPKASTEHGIHIAVTIQSRHVEYNNQCMVCAVTWPCLTAQAAHILTLTSEELTVNRKKFRTIQEMISNF